ncbi:hypothetical protein FIE12Z_5423 [Fusarium flagelliforme]|uniref:Uncharacterized protein n=1 Tax=Fusarium flagelliforme TaxID=2675880 RepID=A0A395MQM5_9HYPO|nr:hypothetical protein FIE12Z_5423 [Fusarium flagelliforme]
MSGNIVLPDPSGVRPYDSQQRRLYMERVFRSQDLWDNLNQRPKFPRVRKLAEENVCEMLDGKGWHNASHSYFEWAVDERIWVAVHLKVGVSRTYKRWRQSRGKSIEELPGRATRAHRFREAPEDTDGNVSAVTANTPQPPAGQTASSRSLVSQSGPASVQAQPGSTADVIPRVPAPKQEVDHKDQRMTGNVDPGIPSWPLPAARDNEMQLTQEPSDAGRGIDDTRSSGRLPESERGQGTPVPRATHPVGMTATGGAPGRDLAAPGLPSPSPETLAIERLQREFQELRETSAWMIEELQENKAGSARIIGQMRIELNATVKILQTDQSQQALPYVIWLDAVAQRFGDLT